MASVRIAMAQINTTVGDLAGNLDTIAKWIGKAKEAGSRIVTFPELCLCGYPPEDLLMKQDFLAQNRTALEKLVPFCRDIAVLVGFANCEDGKTFNSAALIHNGKLMGIYNKIELPNYGVFDEKRYFSPGEQCFAFDLNGCRIATTICEDIWIPGSVTESCAVKNHAEVVLNISASPFHAGKLELRRRIVERFAVSTGCTVFFNNLVGGQDELVFDGGGMVVDPTGKLLATAKRFQEDLLIYDYSVMRDSSGADFWNMKVRPCITACPDSNIAGAGRSLFAPEMSRIEETFHALVIGTRDYVSKNGFKKVLIGLSGGIDSALTAAIAVEALGREQVVGVTMPSTYTSKETFSDASILAENLHIELITLPIRDIFKAYSDTLLPVFGDGRTGVEFENIQARIRGNLLMALSNHYGWLVLTTGNKSETAVGYCTLYGDMAGGFAVIKDVPKTVVYELSEYVNDRAGCFVIPKSILERAPSAELRPDQKDEDSLPPYCVLDPILKAYVEEDKSPDQIDFDPEIVRQVVQMVDRNEYKRRQAPPGVKITPKAFGKDWRLPLTNKYFNGRIKEDNNK